MPAADLVRPGDVEATSSVTFFVPCLNEEDNVLPTLRTLIGLARELELAFEVLVFDDASSDRTVQRVREFMQSMPRTPIRLFENRTTQGLGSNYFAGSREAVGEHYMLVNGDHAESQEALESILRQRGEADMIVPYFDDRDVRGLVRRSISQLFTGLVHWLSGTRLRYYNGPVLHRRELVARWQPKTSGFAYQAELITGLLGEGATAVEVQIANQDRETGSSKAFRPSNVVSVALSLLRIGARRLRRAFSRTSS